VIKNQTIFVKKNWFKS